MNDSIFARTCRSTWLVPLLLGIGCGWSLAVAINLAVGISIGAGLALVMHLNARRSCSHSD